MNSTPSVFHIDRLELVFGPKPWAFANKRRAEIDAFFEATRKEKPTLWNGRVLLMVSPARHGLHLLPDQLPRGSTALPRSLRAVAGAVDLATVTAAADQRLGATIRTKKQPRRRRVTMFASAIAM